MALRRGKKNDHPRPPVSDEGGDRRHAGHLGAGERSVRGVSRSRSRLRISPRTGASTRSEVAPGVGKVLNNRRAEAVTAKRVSADGPKHQTIADGRSVRGFMRSRSHPQKSPRPGSRSAAKSAGFRANGKYRLPEGRVCRRAAVVRRDPEAGREPLGGGRGNTGVAAVHKAGEERRLGATPATATPRPSSCKARDPLRPSKARPFLVRAKRKKIGGPRQSPRSECLPTG